MKDRSAVFFPFNCSYMQGTKMNIITLEGLEWEPSIATESEGMAYN
jgi:hypothetical protein